MKVLCAASAVILMLHMVKLPIEMVKEVMSFAKDELVFQENNRGSIVCVID